jgi:hypothetical protein
MLNGFRKNRSLTEVVYFKSYPCIRIRKSEYRTKISLSKMCVIYFSPKRQIWIRMLTLKSVRQIIVLFVFQNNGGVDTDTGYPYAAVTGTTCNYNPSFKAALVVTGYVKIPSGDEAALLEAVCAGPVSVAVDASKFQFYTGGVFSDASCSSTTLNHMVVATGYGVLNGQLYWIIDNSWGRNLSKWFILSSDSSPLNIFFQAQAGALEDVSIWLEMQIISAALQPPQVTQQLAND